MFTVIFHSEEEVNMAAYALKEYAYKLAERGIDWKQAALGKESDKAFELAERVYQSLSKSQPPQPF